MGADVETPLARGWQHIDDMLAQIATKCDIVRTKIRLHHGTTRARVEINGELSELKTFADEAFETVCRISKLALSGEVEHVSAPDTVPNEDFFPPPGGTSPNAKE